MKFGTYSFFKLSDGSIKCCGRNYNRQLGLDSTSTYISSIQDLPIPGVSEVISGGSHTFFLMEDGSVKCCGNNSLGQLGIGTVSNQINPTDLYLKGVKGIVCGSSYTFFLLDDGTIRCCGQNSYGQLGLGYSSSSVTTVENLPFTGVKKIVCGTNYTFFLMQDGTVKCCGYNSDGQLGLGHTATVNTVLDYPLSGIKDIVCGDSHTFFIMEDGTIKCCGYNQYGQLGLGHTTTPITSLADFPLSGVKKIVCGGYHNFFFMDDGSIKCCGQGTYGRLGVGSTNNVTTPVDLPLEGVKDIICGNTYTFFLMQDGTVKCCGYNSDGQLGLGHTNTQGTVTNVPISDVVGFNTPAIYFEALDRHLIKASGKLYTFANSSFTEISSSISEEVFREHGISDISSIPAEQWATIGEEIEILTWTTKETTPLLKMEVESFKLIDKIPLSLLAWTDIIGDVKLTSLRPSHEIYYALSMDGNIFYSKASGKWEIITDIYNQGMTKQQVEALTQEDYAEIFSPGVLYIKAVLKSNAIGATPYATPYIDNIQINLPKSYKTGGYYIHTNLNQFNTLDWSRINSVSITQDTPEGTDIRYAFSRDGRETWEVFDGSWKKIPLANIGTLGMTKEQVESLTPEQWHPMVWDNNLDTLDVCIYLYSGVIAATPSVDQIYFDYGKIVTPVYTDVLSIPVPNLGYRYTLVNDNYVLKLTEGIAYDDIETDYNFYTTPDRIKLRPLNMGTVIGGKASNIFAFEVINTYDEGTFDVTLRASKDGQMAKEFDTYCLLPDAPNDSEKTKVEMSFTTDEYFDPVYPLTFRLSPNEKRLVYIRVKPTLTTVGNESFQIVLSGRPV